LGEDAPGISNLSEISGDTVIGRGIAGHTSFIEEPIMRSFISPFAACELPIDEAGYTT
jgi:hypothetical protein